MKHFAALAALVLCSACSQAPDCDALAEQYQSAQVHGTIHDLTTLSENPDPQFQESEYRNSKSILAARRDELIAKCGTDFFVSVEDGSWMLKSLKETAAKSKRLGIPTPELDNAIREMEAKP